MFSLKETAACRRLLELQGVHLGQCWASARPAVSPSGDVVQLENLYC